MAYKKIRHTTYIENLKLKGEAKKTKERKRLIQSTVIVLMAMGMFISSNASVIRESNPQVRDSVDGYTICLEKETGKPEITQVQIIQSDNRSTVEVPVVEELDAKKATEEFIFTVSDSEMTKYSSTALNIRAFPTIESGIIGCYEYLAEVKITGVVDESDWVRVCWNNSTGYCNSKYLLDEIPTTTKLDETKDILYEQTGSSGILQVKGDVSQDIIKSIESYLELIPQNVKKHYQNEGWQLIITTEDFGSIYGYGRILALTVYGNPGITYIDDRSSAASAVIHEFGHYIDYTFGFVSSSSEYGEIYCEELSSFTSWHNTHPSNYNTPRECFAEAYQECILHPENMQAYCPRMYAFIMNYSNSL